MFTSGLSMIIMGDPHGCIIGIIAGTTIDMRTVTIAGSQRKGQRASGHAPRRSCLSQSSEADQLR
jgi:hypothetical protein